MILDPYFSGEFIARNTIFTTVNYQNPQTRWLNGPPTSLARQLCWRPLIFSLFRRPIVPMVGSKPPTTDPYAVVHFGGRFATGHTILRWKLTNPTRWRPSQQVANIHNHRRSSESLLHQPTFLFSDLVENCRNPPNPLPPLSTNLALLRWNTTEKSLNRSLIFFLIITKNTLPYGFIFIFD